MRGGAVVGPGFARPEPVNGSYAIKHYCSKAFAENIAALFHTED